MRWVKKGDTVRVYHDIITGENLEGRATVVRVVRSDTEIAQVLVRFDGESETFHRFIAPHSVEGGKP